MTFHCWIKPNYQDTDTCYYEYVTMYYLTVLPFSHMLPACSLRMFSEKFVLARLCAQSFSNNICGMHLADGCAIITSDFKTYAP